MSDSPSSSAPSSGPKEGIHFTFFNFKDDMSLAEREAVMNVTRGLGPLDTVQHLVIGKALPNNRPATGTFDYISIVGFDNPQDHEVYLVCPERMAMGAVFMPTQTRYLHADMDHPGVSILWKTPGERLRHVMTFDFQVKVDQAERDRLIADVVALGQASDALAFTLTENTKPWTPNAAIRWLLIADFADQAAFDAFLASPGYKAVVEDDLLHKVGMVFSGELQLNQSVSGFDLTV